MGLRFDRALSRRILTLAGPVVLAMVSQTAINLLDTIMVGRLPKAESIAGQAAIGHSVIFLWAIGGFLSAISVGTQAITARRFGEGQHERSGRALTNAMFLAVVAGVVASVVGYLITPDVFPFFNQNAEVLQFGVPYCQFRMIAVLSMVATIAVKAFYDGLGRTRVHMTAALIMNALNALLNWLLIFGALGFPRMGVAGAGLASTIASYVGLAFMLLWTTRRADRKRYRYFRLSNLNRRVMWEITRLSVPSGLATVAVMSGFALFLKIVASMDHNEAQRLVGVVLTERPAIYTAATKVIIDILSITFMSCVAFGTATATLVSQSLGAGKPDLAGRYGWTSVKLGVMIVGALGVFALVWPQGLLWIFSKDAEVIDAASAPLRLMGASEGMMAMGLILAQALFGAGNSKFVMYVEVTLHFTCLVPLAYVFGVVLDGGLLGVWAAAFTYISLLSLVMAWKFREGKWKNIRI